MLFQPGVEINLKIKDLSLEQKLEPESPKGV